MNKVRSLILGSAVFALSTAALRTGPVAAAPDGVNPENRPSAHGRRMAGGFGGAPLISLALSHKSELNLTADQVGNLENIRTNFQSQVTPMFQQVRSIDKEIAGLMQKTPADLIQVKSKIQDAEKLRSELRYLRIEALENGKSVLTQQQRDQLRTLVRAQHEQFRNRRSQPS